MLKKLIYASMISVLLAAGAMAQRDPRAAAEHYSGDKFSVSASTPQGARVYAVHRPTAATLTAIDRGLADLFAVARKNHYSRRLNYTDYTVYIGKPDRLKDSTGAYSPDIAIGVAEYAGTIFDQGGYMYAAGMVISPEQCTFLIAEHTKALDRLSNVVRYEGEHIVLYHNDRQRFYATIDHSKSGAHPILQ